MFNRYVFPTKTERITEHVHEHRAPTDDSVSLLKELEREAASKVVSVNRLQDNVLKAEWTVIDNPMNFDLTVVCRMMLNGKEMTFTTDLEKPWRNEHAEKVVHTLLDRLAKHLVTELLTTNRAFQTLLAR